MPHSSSESGSSEIHIAVVGKSKTDTLQETINFLYGFNVGYELARLASDRRYGGFSFNHYVWMRNGRPLDRDARLRVVKLKETSPIELVASVVLLGVAALPSIWILLQIVERAYNIPLNRRKLKAEVEKAERENRIGIRQEERDLEGRATEILESSPASPYLENTIRRFSRSTVIVSEITVTYEKQERKSTS